MPWKAPPGALWDTQDTMASNLQLFDDVGYHWDGMSAKLESSFGSTATPDDFSTYVVKNMGFIAVHCYGRSCEIRLRPQLVSAASFDALKSWVSARRFERIVTVCFKDEWVYGLHIRQDDAIAKLEAMISAAHGPRPGDYLVRHIAKDDLPRATPLHRALHSLIENWPMLSQSVHRDGLSQIIRTSLQGRYHMMKVDGESDTLTFGEIGGGFFSYSDDWRLQSIGKAISQHEDGKYGAWIADCCHKALTSGAPAISDVDAIMMTPKLGRARVRYKRIYLPCRGQGNGTWLLTSSILDPSIDLRFEQLAEVS